MVQTQTPEELEKAKQEERDAKRESEKRARKFAQEMEGAFKPGVA